MALSPNHYNQGGWRDYNLQLINTGEGIEAADRFKLVRTGTYPREHLTRTPSLGHREAIDYDLDGML
jgi:hypothetical protein